MNRRELVQRAITFDDPSRIPDKPGRFDGIGEFKQSAEDRYTAAEMGIAGRARLRSRIWHKKTSNFTPCRENLLQ